MQAPKHYFGIDDLVIWVVAQRDDGPGGTLAAAAQCVLRDETDAQSRVTGLDQPLVGYFYLDLDDIPGLRESGLLVPTITHEIGHILGIGSGYGGEGYTPGSWYRQGVCDDDPDRCFTASRRQPYVPGPGAIAAFNELGGFSAEGQDIYYGRRVPTEPGGRSGSSGSHWSEAVLAEELMTPIIDRTSNPLSKITARILEDMGMTLRSNWAEAVDDYCILSIEPYPGQTHRCAPAMDKPSEKIGMSADEKVARGFGFDLRGDVLVGPLWVIGEDGTMRRIR